MGIEAVGWFRGNQSRIEPAASIDGEVRRRAENSGWRGTCARESACCPWNSIESEDERRSEDMRSLPGKSSASSKAVECAEKKALRNQPKTTSLYEKPKRAKSDGNTMTMLASTSVASRGPGGRQVEKDAAKQMRGKMV